MNLEYSNHFIPINAINYQIILKFPHNSCQTMNSLNNGLQLEDRIIRWKLMELMVNFLSNDIPNPCPAEVYAKWVNHYFFLDSKAWLTLGVRYTHCRCSGIILMSYLRHKDPIRRVMQCLCTICALQMLGLQSDMGSVYHQNMSCHSIIINIYQSIPLIVSPFLTFPFLQ